MMIMAAVSAALGLERDLHFYERCAKATEHLLDHMIGPNAKNLVTDFSRPNAGCLNATQGAQADSDPYA